MRFFPHTTDDISSMLETIGVDSIEALTAHVPADLRACATINLAPGRSEQEVVAMISALASRSAGADGFKSFQGGGYYRHYVPAAVRAIASRAEFATSYTPYQAEASQGTLQAIFEFQTLICQLSGLEVANASMYDGASAAAEAVLMARRMNPKGTVVALSRALWPDYRIAIHTYLSALKQIEVVELPFDAAIGSTDLSEIRKIADQNLLCVVAGYPNGFGVIEPLSQIAAISHAKSATLISATAEPLALAMLKSPAELGVDIAVGEGQSFGLPLQYGGPGVGFMAARSAYLRQMPGRLVGQTRDRDGHRAFSLTLATREQHIRREKATSNICTNHSLCALTVAAYLSLLGRRGLRELAAENCELAHAAVRALDARGLRRRFSGPFFNEFTIEVGDVSAALAAAEKNHILAGIDLGPDYPELHGSLLVCATELNSENEIAALCDSIAEAA
jgi:glycine dehydrogenase subunit 1